MPVTKTAKRALRGSIRKAKVNKTRIVDLEVALRFAKKSKASKDINKAISLIDRAAKNKIIEKNKAGRMKSSLSKLTVSTITRNKKSKEKIATKKPKK